MPSRPDDLTLHNWIDAPYNRWGFWHVRQMTRTARISRGDGPVTGLPRAGDPPAVADLVFAHEGITYDWTTWLDATQTDAMVVIHNDAVVYEYVAEGYGHRDTHLLMSCSKSLTSLCIGTLVADGLVDTAAPVTDYIAALRGTSFDGATVQHLLDMRTGTHFNEEDYDDPASDGRLIEEVSGYRPRTHDGLPPDTAAWITKLENEREHGSAFVYRSILTDVLAWIIQEVTGEHFSTAFSKRIWGPIGAERDAEVIVDDIGFPAAEGGISTTIRDFARVGLLCLQEGRLGERRILPEGWFERLRVRDDDAIRAFAAAPEASAALPDASYHDQWWIMDPLRGIYSAYGINGQQLLVHHPSDTVIAKFSTWPTADSGSALQDAGLFALCEVLEAQRAG